MYIIFDSNIWITELGLNSAKGSATRFFVNKVGAKVVLPEVVKLETQRNLERDLKNWIFEIEKNYRHLLPLFGSLKEIVLPTNDEVYELVSGIFARSKLNLTEIPLSLGSARSSFLKTIDKLPPSDRKQQFKDGVIWADCLSLLQEDDVWLVTDDNAFYQDYKKDKGLAETLRQEAADYPNEIRIYSTISDMLSEIAIEIELNKKKLIQEFFEISLDSIARILSNNSFEIVKNLSAKTDLFATEEPNKLFVEFEFLYQLDDISSDSRTDGQLKLRGDCIYHTDNQEFSMMRNFGEGITFKRPDGDEEKIQNQVIFVESAVIGHKTKEHSVRYKLTK